MTLRVTLWLALLAGGGCATVVAPPWPEATFEVPAQWSAAEASAPGTAGSLSRWWLRFDEPLLDRLVSRALAAHSSIQSARAALQQSRAARDVVAAGLAPTVSGSTSVQRSRAGDNGTGNSFRLGLDAAWEPDVFGATRHGLDAADALVRSSAASLGDVQVSVAAEVGLAYLALRGAQARLAIAEANLASQLDTLQITRWRLQAGLVDALDAEQANASAEQTRAQLPALQTQIAQTGHALAVLTGQPPAALDRELAIDPTAAMALPRAADPLPLGIPADTLRQRPDVRAAEDQVRAAMARVSQADAARRPSFRLGGSIGLSALTLGALTDSAALVASLLASAAVPIVDGGAGLAQVRAQRAALDQAAAAWQAAVLTALQEVEDALAALRGGRERLLRLQRAADSATSAASLARQRYDSGLADFQVVLDTQRTQLGAQDSMAGARADLGAAQVRLFKALGGGWREADADASSAPARINRPHAASPSTGAMASAFSHGAPQGAPR
ncbi:efflux transporter outer membrane subunit [Ideonella sp. A 288]|uniref:efflux transporter outer membrane subunit n=1 Tax=Ideonella sp. A 288 TaxID=1962181 RepID=UPI002873DCD7|nr:efflux transporter outer membrane subunit [Ideonella sp. A 288]